MRAAIAVIAAAGLLASVSAARADLFTVTVWGGYGNNLSLGTTTPDQADLAGASNLGTAVASFTYDGPINWVNTGANNGTNPNGNLYSQFFDGADISGFTSPGGEYAGAGGLSTFLGNSMSSQGNSWFSFLQVAGTTSGGLVTMAHDDGASVYSGATVDYYSPNQTAEDIATFAMPSGPFTIDYIEANGSPSILTFKVPEPGTLAIFASGLLGLTMMMQRRCRRR